MGLLGLFHNAVLRHLLREPGRVLGTYAGFTLCDCRSDTSTPDGFEKHAKKALALVEHFDSRRYHRVQIHMKCIANQQLAGIAHYNPHCQACLVDASLLPEKVGEACRTVLLGGILVHEATHGLLWAKGIPYRGRFRPRIERLCHAEEARFLMRVDPELRRAW